MTDKTDTKTEATPQSRQCSKNCGCKDKTECSFARTDPKKPINKDYPESEFALKAIEYGIHYWWGPSDDEVIYSREEAARHFIAGAEHTKEELQSQLSQAQERIKDLEVDIESYKLTIDLEMQRVRQFEVHCRKIGYNATANEIEIFLQLLKNSPKL